MRVAQAERGRGRSVVERTKTKISRIILRILLDLVVEKTSLFLVLPAGKNSREFPVRLVFSIRGEEALNYFKEDQVLFDVYHTGYQEQMSHWPEQPVNLIIKWLKEHDPSFIVADFGCGDARLAKNVKNKVFSFDLVSKDPSVIACDMSNTPLDSSSVDVAVFCLSLMGVNYESYLAEARRVLKPRGWLLISEVKSRFDPSNGGADPKKFIKAVCDLGFVSALKDFSNKMFILLYFKKKDEKILKGKDVDWPELKPCLYKRR
ncbi:ribosomal RNA-processing protein 8 isoform X2 [Momordica charantia]|uniref:Ribosomal RNA-processing protein 8 n=1 Tax=Momordica charantia TaxID=3673 RepID=A0A6J1BZ12_MOMCH|nr:ribosomal RNA-processing protein 8 isoform X2 [Momordica charantia]